MTDQYRWNNILVNVVMTIVIVLLVSKSFSIDMDNTCTILWFPWFCLSWIIANRASDALVWGINFWSSIFAVALHAQLWALVVCTFYSLCETPSEPSCPFFAEAFMQKILRSYTFQLVNCWLVTFWHYLIPAPLFYDSWSASYWQVWDFQEKHF